MLCEAIIKVKAYLSLLTYWESLIYSLTPGRYGSNNKSAILFLNWWIYISNISCENDSRQMPQNLFAVSIG